ncbi:MAG: FG-GAP repeat protein [Gammaproteobacteria bacterium]
MSSAGDVNGDGVDDLLIGAPYGGNYPESAPGPAMRSSAGRRSRVTVFERPSSGPLASIRSSAPRATTSSRAAGPETSSAAARVTIGYSLSPFSV